MAFFLILIIFKFSWFEGDGGKDFFFSSFKNVSGTDLIKILNVLSNNVVFILILV